MQREWIANDYYADLGLTRRATADEISEQYRELAKELHPDRRPDDPVAEATFKRIARAYAVLGNAERRRRYDAARDAVFDRGYAPTGGTTRPVASGTRTVHPFRWSPRLALFSGFALLLLGLGAVAWIITITARDNAIAGRGVVAEATVVQVAPTPLVTFRTRAGEPVTTRAPLIRDRRNGGYRLNEGLRVRYDPSDPSRIVVDESRLARDVTMWIVALKLVVCGGILVWFGLRRRGPSAGAAPPVGRAAIPPELQPSGPA